MIHDVQKYGISGFRFQFVSASIFEDCLSLTKDCILMPQFIPNKIFSPTFFSKFPWPLNISPFVRTTFQSRTHRNRHATTNFVPLCCSRFRVPGSGFFESCAVANKYSQLRQFPAVKTRLNTGYHTGNGVLPCPFLPMDH